MLDAGWQRVSVDAGFDPGQEGLPGLHRKVEFPDPITASWTGYIYIWVSNESENTRVWFDDLTISHSTSLVTQATDYGVWGDVIREQKTDPTLFYKHGYQGQFSEKDEETGWNHFELREYDAVIGRWLIPDPARQYHSPYVAFGNNPVSRMDPDGGTDGDPNDPVPFSVGFSRYSYQRHSAERESRLAGGFWGGSGDQLSSMWDGAVNSVTTWEGFKGALSSIEKSILNTNTAGIEFDPAGNAVKTHYYNALLNWGSLTDYEKGSTVGFYGGFEATVVVGMFAPEIAGSAFTATRLAFGPFRQWIRVGPSHSYYLGKSTSLSIRWGASPVHNWKYVMQIGDPTLRMINQGLRQMKVPINNWRSKDAGHIHLKK